MRLVHEIGTKAGLSLISVPAIFSDNGINTAKYIFQVGDLLHRQTTAFKNN